MSDNKNEYNYLILCFNTLFIVINIIVNFKCGYFLYSEIVDKFNELQNNKNNNIKKYNKSENIKSDHNLSYIYKKNNLNIDPNV